MDGTLGYYHDETAQDEEDRVLIRFNVRNIKIGQECHGEKPFPSGTVTVGMPSHDVRPRIPALEGSVQLSEGFYRHCFWASVNSNSWV